MILLQKKSVCSIMNTYKTHEMISNCLTQKLIKTGRFHETLISKIMVNQSFGLQEKLFDSYSVLD